MNIILYKIINYKNLKYITKNLTHLHYIDSFNQPINNLPQNLKKLTFGWVFNQSVDNLPQSLLNLTFNVNLENYNYFV